MTEPLKLALTALPGIPLIKPGDDLTAIILTALADSGETLQAGDILVLAQKIVSKAEGRYAYLKDVEPSPQALELAAKTEKDPRLVELILSESVEVVRHRPGVIIVAHRLGYVSANAGIDASNVRQTEAGARVLLLPKDPDKSCADLREAIKTATGVEVGVLINDSHNRAWRNGATGITLGAAGVPTLLDLRGQPDLFDRDLRSTEVGLADEIASAASILMGQANEGRPVVLVRGLPYPSREGNAQELIRPKENDLFR